MHFKNGGTPGRGRVGALSLALVLATSLASLAEAGDADTTEALKALKAARAKKDAVLVTELVGKLVDLHNGTQDKSVKTPIQGALGGLLKNKKLDGVRSAAARALGRLDDAEGAFKHLKKVFPSANSKASDGISLAALEATGTLKPPAAIELTLKLIAKGKDTEILKVAAANIGGYVGVKEQVKIARVLCDALVRYRKEFDKGAKAKKPTEQRLKQERWITVAPAIRTSLNLLTGSERTSADEWLSAYEEANRKPEAWFAKG